LRSHGVEPGPDALDARPGVQELALGALLPPLQAAELGEAMCRPVLLRLLEALPLSFSGQGFFGEHGEASRIVCAG
jgi:hypothetical protein